MKTGNKQSIKSLVDEISRLYKEKETILIPFIIRSIPTKIMDAFTDNPNYFVVSSIARFYDGKRDLIFSGNYRFPIKEHQPTVSVPPGTLEEIERIDLLIHNKRKLIIELQESIQLESSC